MERRLLNKSSVAILTQVVNSFRYLPGESLTVIEACMSTGQSNTPYSGKNYSDRQ